MNERIQKLYDQADKFAKENRTQTISGPGNNYFELFHEKFAELIVRECADIAKGEPASFYDRDAYKLGRKFASEDVLKHFGVEE